MDTTSIAKAIRDRAERGMDLHRSGAVSVHGDLYVVKGTARCYTVALDHPTMGETCNCPDHRERCRDAGMSCKHVVAATLYAARERCRRGAKIIRH